MKKIGIVYHSKDIENILQQTDSEVEEKGTLIGLAFAPDAAGTSIVNLKIVKIFYQPVDTPVGMLSGLNDGYYGEEMPFSNSSLDSTAPFLYTAYELGDFDSAELFLGQARVMKTDTKSQLAILEFSDEIGEEGLPDFGFSLFRKEDLLSHISGGTHIIVSGSKIIMGQSGVRPQNQTTHNIFFNLKIQTILAANAAESERASLYVTGQLTGMKSEMHGKPCPPFWGGN